MSKNLSKSFDPSAFIRSGALVALPDGQLLLGWGSRRWSEKKQVNAFYFPHFFIEAAPAWLVMEETCIMSCSALASKLQSAARRAVFDWHFDLQQVESAFVELQELFKQGKLQKAVTYLFATANGIMSPSQIAASLSVLLGCNGYPYGFWDAGSGMVGATPELLLHIKGKKLQTVACAGTLPAGQDLLADKKIMHEHQIVVDGIKEQLIALGKMQIGTASLVNFGPLAHLITPICAELHKETPFETLVSRLHPTPALGTYPKKAGQKWLRRYAEALPRGRYGAPVGCWREAEGCCFVGIRNVQWEEGRLRIGVGCGIVQESKIAAELAEFQLKLAAVRELLAL